MNSRTIVSRLLILAIGVGLIGAGLFVGSAAFAQTAERSASASQESVLEPIAPFVNESAVLVLRLDLNAFDYDRFGETLQALFNQALLLAGYSQESIEACDAEFVKTLDALKADAKEGVDDFEKNFGFKTAFFAAQNAKGEGACVIVPAKDMTKEQVDKVLDVFKKSGKLNAALYKKSFILVSPRPLKELGAYYKNFKPAPNDELEAFFNANSDKVLAFYASRFKIRPFFTPSKETLDQMRQDALKAAKEAQELKATQEISAAQGIGATRDLNGLRIPGVGVANPFARTNKLDSRLDRKNYDPFAEAPQCVRNLIEVFDASFVGAQGYVDAAGLSANLTLKFNTAVNAGKFVESLDDIIEEIALRKPDGSQNAGLQDFFGSENLGTGAALLGLRGDVGSASRSFIAKYRLEPLWSQMTCGDLKRYLPKSYDTNVVFGGSAVDAVKRVGSNSIFVLAFFSALAAREGGIAAVKADASSEEEFQPFDSEDDSETNSEISQSPTNLSSDADALFQRGCNKLYGNNVEKIDVGEGLKLLQQAIDAGSLEAQAELVMWNFEPERDFEKICALARKSAEAGVPTGALIMGLVYQTGVDGIPADESESEKLLKIAFDGLQKEAEQGNALAQYKLRACYLYGLGTKPDSQKASELLLKSAEQGNAVAQLELAVDKTTGLDAKKRSEWLWKSANQGHPIAQTEIGNLYFEGDPDGEIKQDYAKAVEWYEKAAKQGHARAQFYLGSCYAEGTGVKQDARLGLEYIKKAAEQDDLEALQTLAKAYRLRNDEKKAAEFEKRAEEVESKSAPK